MTNLQLYLTIGIPSLLVLLAWIQTNARLARLETTTDRGFNLVDQRLDRIDADLRHFYHLTGKLEGRVEALEKR